MTSKKYVTKSAWENGNGTQWEWFVENTENGQVAHPEHGYASKLDCDNWVKEMDGKESCKKLGHDWHTPGPHGNQPTRCWRCGIVRSES
jgi:hypothetical protein